MNQLPANLMTLERSWLGTLNCLAASILFPTQTLSGLLSFKAHLVLPRSAGMNAVCRIAADAVSVILSLPM